MQDFRRNVFYQNYQPVQCGDCKTEPVSSYEEGGCISIEKCDKCH